MDTLQHIEQDIFDNIDDVEELSYYLKNEVEVFAQCIRETNWEHSVKVFDADGKSRTLSVGLALYGYEVYSTNDEHSDCPQSSATNLRTTIKKHSMVDSVTFDVIILAHNTLSDYLTEQELYRRLAGYADVLDKNGIFLIAARASEQILRARIDHDKPRIFSTRNGRYIHFALRERISAGGCIYTQDHYIIHEIAGQQTIHHTTTQHRAWRRAEIHLALSKTGFARIQYRSLPGDWFLLSARKMS